MSQAKQNNDLSTTSLNAMPQFLSRMLQKDPLSSLEKKSRETLTFLEKCNQDANSALNPELQEELFREIRHRTPLDHDSYPSDLKHYRYFVRQREALNYPQFWRAPLNQENRQHQEKLEQAHCYLDINKLAADYDYFDLGDLAISPDEQRLALTTDTEGDEIYSLQLVNLSNNHWQTFDDLPPLASDLIWTEDQETLLCFPLDDTQRPWQVMALNISSGQTSIIFEEPDARFWVGCSKSRDRKHLFIESLSKQSTRYYLLPADQPLNPPQLLIKQQEGHEYHADSIDDQLYIRSNLQQADFGLYRLDQRQITQPLSPADFLQQASVIHPPSKQKTFEGFELFQNHLLILQRDHTRGRQELSIHSLDGKKQHDFEPPYPLVSINLSDNPDSDTPWVRLELESFNQPPTLYRYTMARQQLEQLRQMPLNNTDLSQFTSQQILIPSWDGTPIPVSLVGKKTLLAAQKPQPVLLYAYGAYGDPLDPWFSSSRLSLMERDVIFAIAHVRGGGDCGEHWYHQGRLGYKENSMRDLEAVIRALLKQGITEKEQLIVQGGSAAGIVLGALYNRSPELVTGIIAEVPFVDVLRTMSRPELPLTIGEYEEWGNPQEPEAHWRIRHYSPLDNLKPETHQTAQRQPKLWIEAGLNDPRVQYWEPAKWAWRLKKAGIEKVWLRTRMDSGHGGGSGRDQSYRETAETQSVALMMLNKDK
ncbi:prolyl oligopeptidase family serine peptidase [Oceanospirillum sp.]|uniref:prolyl oligopeptidase family serine peptidase n=1 Tax=Oceanospirillum sp. TaxID=2021254 RepID=UPI003A9434AA